MAINHLTNAEMVNATQGWIEPGSPTKAAFLAVETLAPMVPKLERAIGGLREVQRVSLDLVIVDLNRERTEADLVHDCSMRAGYYMLEAYRELARSKDDQERVRAIDDLRQVLMPGGLEMVNASYAEEAGQADLLASRLTPAVREELSAIPMQSGTLLDVVRAWISAGEELGRLETRVADTQLPSQRGPVAQARALWMRTVQAIRSVVSLEDEVDVLIERALYRVTMAEKAAARRLSAAGDGEVDGAGGDEPAGDGGGGDEAGDESDAGGAALAAGAVATGDDGAAAHAEG